MVRGNLIDLRGHLRIGDANSGGKQLVQHAQIFDK